MEKMNNYEVEKKSAGHWQLSVNGTQSACPFAGAFAMEGTMGGFGGFMRLACTTGCPMASLEKDTDGDLKYTVHCGGHPNKMIVTEKNKKPEKPAGDSAKLISMP